MATKAKKASAVSDAQSFENFVKAVGHPLRLRIWTILSERKASAIELSKEFGCESSEVSYHIKVLKDCKVIREVGRKKRRGATELYFRASKRPMVDADGLAELPPVVANSMIGQAFQRMLDDFLAAGKADLFKDQVVEMSRLPMFLDAEGRVEAQEDLDAQLERFHDIQVRSDERRSKSGGKGRHYTAGQMCFEVPKGSAS